jgi:hypothetical protein
MNPFLKFQSNLNTYYTKLKDIPIEFALVTPKNGLSSVQLPMCVNMERWSEKCSCIATNCSSLISCVCPSLWFDYVCRCKVTKWRFFLSHHYHHFFLFLLEWRSPSSSLVYWSSMLVFCVFLLTLSWCVCSGVLHHESFDECAFLCMCRHGTRNEEHFYIAIIVFSWYVCVMFVTFVLLSICLSFFIPLSCYVCLCVYVNT